METNEKRIIEVNGVKLEVDLRHAKRIDEFRVGDKIKMLRKKWGDPWESHLGVIAGFDNFEHHPTIIIAFLDSNKLEFCYFNSESKDIEICAAYDTDLTYKKADILAAMDREIAKKQTEIEELEQRKAYFLDNFGRFFEPEVAAESA